MEEKRCSLRYPYLSIKTQAEQSFGGNQSWSDSRIMRKYGCGVVGMSDVLLYLGLHQTDYDTDLFHGILREDGCLSYPKYNRYLRKMRRRYLHIIPGFGVPGWMLPVAFNKYFRHYRINLRAGWCLQSGKILSRIETMLRKDIPVILAIGPNFPLFWARKKLPLYRYENGEFITATEIKAHFVVVTGIVNDYLQISSWGKEYYISWKEYHRYVKKYSCFGVSNICRIREKKSYGKKRDEIE